MTTYIPQITLPYTVFANPAASILLPVTLGAAVGYSTRPVAKDKYRTIKQPPYRPPAEAFGPVWTALYGIAGYAAYRAVTKGMSSLSSVEHVRMAKHGATLYTLQLGLNLVWMPLFFTLRRPIEATADLVALVGINGYLAYLWGSVDRVAGLCMIPYLGWLGFATYLSAGAGYLNNWNIADKPEPAPKK